ADSFYWLVVNAPLHRSVTIPMYPGDAVPDVILAGGDLNRDGCIGPVDLMALVGLLDVADSAATDVTGDGLTDVSDLAIVTGNYQPDCELAATETPEPEATSEATPEATAEIAPEIEVTPEITPEVEVTAELTPETTVEVTAEATVEITPELEVTPELTSEVTVEITADVTPLPTAEATEALTPEGTEE